MATPERALQAAARVAGAPTRSFIETISYIVTIFKWKSLNRAVSTSTASRVSQPLIATTFSGFSLFVGERGRLHSNYQRWAG